jgi:predicted HTH domain antitoxin
LNFELGTRNFYHKSVDKKESQHNDQHFNHRIRPRLVAQSGGAPAQFNSEAKFLLVAKLYELGRLTSGQAALLAGQGRVDFLLGLSRIGVPMSNLQAEDLGHELDFARHG